MTQPWYAVFFHPSALEAAGPPILPYLTPEPEAHLRCRDLLTGGSFVEMTVEGTNAAGKKMDVTLMVPTNMIRLIVSVKSESGFGFA